MVKALPAVHIPIVTLPSNPGIQEFGSRGETKAKADPLHPINYLARPRTKKRSSPPFSGYANFFFCSVAHDWFFFVCLRPTFTHILYVRCCPPPPPSAIAEKSFAVPTGGMKIRRRHFFGGKARTVLSHKVFPFFLCSCPQGRKRLSPPSSSFLSGPPSSFIPGANALVNKCTYPPSTPLSSSSSPCQTKRGRKRGVTKRERRAFSLCLVGDGRSGQGQTAFSSPFWQSLEGEEGERSED